MTYLEIIEWIEKHLVELFEQFHGEFKVYYLDTEGYQTETVGKDLVSIVLEINNKELIK